MTCQYDRVSSVMPLLICKLKFVIECVFKIICELELAGLFNNLTKSGQVANRSEVDWLSFVLLVERYDFSSLEFSWKAS